MRSITGMGTAIGRLRAKAGLYLGLFALGLVLAGCDKCSDFFSPAKSESAGALLACKDNLPRPR